MPDPFPVRPGVPASALAVTDGTWPLPLADGTLPLPFAVNFTTLRIEDNAPTSTSEGTLPFALESRGGLVVPKEWLQDGTLPFPLAQELSKLSIKVAIQSGLTLPRGLQGTGKLVFPDSFDGSNPWPHIPKDMLPYVLTGEGTINLTDGTWPLPRLESGDRIIPIKRVMENFSVTSEPVHPDDRATVVAPEGTKASPDPVNPDDLPPTDVISNGPSGVGPDPVNPDDRIKKGCGCGH